MEALINTMNLARGEISPDYVHQEGDVIEVRPDGAGWTETELSVNFVRKFTDLSIQSDLDRAVAAGNVGLEFPYREEEDIIGPQGEVRSVVVQASTRFVDFSRLPPSTVDSIRDSSRILPVFLESELPNSIMTRETRGRGRIR